MPQPYDDATSMGSIQRLDAVVHSVGGYKYLYTSKDVFQLVTPRSQLISTQLSSISRYNLYNWNFLYIFLMNSVVPGPILLIHTLYSGLLGILCCFFVTVLVMRIMDFQVCMAGPSKGISLTEPWTNYRHKWWESSMSLGLIKIQYINYYTGYE